MKIEVKCKIFPDIGSTYHHTAPGIYEIVLWKDHIHYDYDTGIPDCTLVFSTIGGGGNFYSAKEFRKLLSIGSIKIISE